MQKNNKLTILFLFCLALQAVIASQSFAGEAKITNKLASTLLEAGQPQKALDLLRGAIKEGSQDTQIWFLAGVSAKAVNRPLEAKGYFEKVIELDPENAHRAKLELAEIAYATGDEETSKKYLQEVKKAAPPERVGANIDQFLTQIEEQGVPKNWQLTVSLGMMYDSNANAGPDTYSVIMFGLPFTLSNSAQDTEDFAMLYRIGARHNYQVTDDFGWTSNANLSYTDYSDLNYLDSLVFSVSSGPSLKISDRVVVTAPLVFDRVKYGHEYDYFTYNIGLAPQLRYGLTQNIFLNFTAVASHKTYRANSDRDTGIYQFSSSVFYQPNRKSYVSFGTTIGREECDLDYYAQDMWAVNARYGYAFTIGIQASLSASYTNSDYDGKEAAYFVTRDDDTIRFGGELSYLIQKIDTTASLSIYHTDNDSNIDIYTYDKNVITFSLSKSW